MKKSWLILIAIPLLLLSRGEAYACKCGKPSVEWSFEKVPVIFSGEVVKLHLFRAIFKIEKMWKGKPAEEIVMLTGETRGADGYLISSSCNFRYARGEKYLVYASGSITELKASVCSRTKPLKSATDDVRELERLKRAGDKRERGVSTRAAPNKALQLTAR